MAGAAISKLAVPWVPRASAQGARTLTFALINDVTTLDPFNTYDNVALSIERAVYDGLVGFTPDMKVRPELATSWEASADAKTFTFHLRPNVKFHDGTPLNAAAVKLNFDRVRNPANKLIRQTFFDPISSIDAVNDTTVRFNLKAPFGAWLYTLAHPCSRIISPAAIGKGGDFVARNMVGSGPFRFASWTPGQQVVLERNPEFWQSGQPEVDRLIIKPVPEDDSRVAMLLSGDAHFIYPVPNVQADAVSRASGVTLQKQWSNVQQDAQMHCQHEPFRNPLVRQALNYAIDKQALVRVILGGLGRVMDSPVASVITGYSVVQAGGWPYDVAKAKTLLAQAGFPKGFETTMWLSNSTELMRLSEMLQQMLAKVGVTVHLQAMELGTLMAIRFKPIDQNQTQMNLNGWSSATGDADWALRPIFDSHAWPPTFNNIAFYKNPQVDALLAAGLATADQAKRNKIYAEASQIIWNDAPHLFLYTPQTLAGLRTGVTGVWALPDMTCDFRQAALARV